MTSARERRGTAVVTGASAGIGLAYAERLAATGHDVVLVARRADRLADLADRLRRAYGGTVTPLTADLADPEGLAAVAERVTGDDVTHLVNNAGINGYGPFAGKDPGLIAAVLALNVTAPTLLTRAALPGLLARGRGAVVNVASLLAFSGAQPPGPLPHRAVYAGSKGYLVTFSRILAAELVGTPVQVQVLCPGLTDTEFHLVDADRPLAGREPRSSGRGMAAADVVDASLAGLAADETVCVPGLADPAAVDRLLAAEAGLRTAAGSPLADRYRPATG
ncbi:SDR family NAD(P)-dependent oxidoreductase [Streptantibioticus silvisoli]|uniref:SDR family NAD(P)-dependent oxidoreductase n=1 Tax=Streptantibioticus silvisoli TaxID=2705255 RepID=A0ABT6VW81_9ACTN|nr:SDR family NAD(P)-dependent oxidoreductase [Streptantibioticus silvisoli]MDI5962746.1 SDR family NAD(P)-dependent oxidoreductase [Streptantibioticus silvisoli]